MNVLPIPHPRARLVLPSALAALLMLAAVPALARTADRAAPDAASAGRSAPASASVPAPVALAPAGVSATAADSVVCDLVRGLELCTHGDDDHLATAATADGGSTSSTTSTRLGCYGDGRSGPRVQAVYARPDASPDRLASLMPSFRAWAGAVEKDVDDSAHKTRGARHVRFTTLPSGSSCTLSVLPLTLPATAFSSFSATVSALQDRGLDRPYVKYLVWADATGYCGVASAYRDDKPGADNMNNGAFPSYARVDRKCWGKAETHEVVHMLGAVQARAPHATEGMHCSDGVDVMCYADGTRGSAQTATCPPAHARLLDCRSDDYFSTSPSPGSWLAAHWNLADSAFLARGWTDPAPPATAPRPSTTPAPASPRPSTQPSTKPSAQPSTQPSPRPSSSTLPLPLPLPTLLPVLR